MNWHSHDSVAIVSDLTCCPQHCPQRTINKDQNLEYIPRPSSEKDLGCDTSSWSIKGVIKHSVSGDRNLI